MEYSGSEIIAVGSDKSLPSIEEVEVVYIPQRGSICNQAIKVIKAIVSIEVQYKEHSPKLSHSFKASFCVLAYLAFSKPKLSIL